ncbi:MAG: right-handed parallel beta-helix repeat-containing protein [Verrucomicrobiae bacterium]|nr:right-handed parallel beta-helix repeat-containing protein [Verrucomicrobiae bacterium]
MEQASEGDTLILSPGVYAENIRIEKRLTLRGEPGAILDGGAEFHGEWTSAGDGLDGVFFTPAEKRPEGLLVDGRFLAEIRFDRAQSKGDWYWQTLLERGTPLSGFDAIRALWTHHPKEKRLYLRFADGRSPVTRNLSWIRSGKPLITIAQASGVVVEGLTFARGVIAVEITEGASGAVVRNCKIESYEETGIMLSGGASDCTVEACGITRGAYEEWQPSLENDRANYEIWRVHKSVGRYDRNGIVLFRAGAGNRILNNRISRVFDGIALGDYKVESLDAELTDPDHGRGTEIAGNLIENTRDSGIELGAGCIDVHVHHNTLRQTHGGLRFKVPRIGPVYIHHNRLIDGAPFNIWFSMDASTAEGYVYHNTIVRGGRSALEFSSFNHSPDFGAPNWHFLNNLVLNEEDGFFSRGRNTPSPDFHAGHNIVTGGKAPWPDDVGRDPGSRYEVEIPYQSDGVPAPRSAAIDAGVDLSTFLEGQPLPGCEPGYFKGQSPDAGAVEVE